MICFTCSSLLIRNKVIECPIFEGKINSPNNCPYLFYILIVYIMTDIQPAINAELCMIYIKNQEQHMSYLCTFFLFTMHTILPSRFFFFSLFFFWIMLLLKYYRKYQMNVSTSPFLSCALSFHSLLDFYVLFN